MPQMKTLIELFPCLKQLAILIRRFAISSGNSGYKLLESHNVTKLLESHNITKFLKEKKRKLCARHRTCCTLSPPIQQLILIMF